MVYQQYILYLWHFTFSNNAGEAKAEIFTFLPNPVQNVLTINIDNRVEDQKYVVQIMDLLGNTVYTSTLIDDQHKINVDHIANGLYLARITKNDKFYQVQKIIIQK